MRKIICSFLLSSLLGAVPAAAQQAHELRQVSLSRWKIGSANYSGITPVGEGLYAVVSDKGPVPGFFLLHIQQHPATGEITNVYLKEFVKTAGKPGDGDLPRSHDTEGIAYYPVRKSLFISAEDDQSITEYDLSGHATGRQMSIPVSMDSHHILGNYGFEALAYDSLHRCFWTVTETMLPADGRAASTGNPGGRNLLRLQSFDEQLQPLAQYPYRMDAGISDDLGKNYVFGVPAITALPDGRLLVLEREANVTEAYLASWVRCKLFLVQPAQSYQIDSSTVLSTLDNNRWMNKTLLADFTTHLSPFNLAFANYEGMCLGRRLDDGRQTVLLISDSQGGYGVGIFHLRDYIKVLVLDDSLSAGRTT